MIWRVILLAAQLSALALFVHAAPPPGVDPDSQDAIWFRSQANSLGENCCGTGDGAERPVRRTADENGYRWEVYDDISHSWLAADPRVVDDHANTPHGAWISWIRAGRVICLKLGGAV